MKKFIGWVILLIAIYIAGMLTHRYWWMTLQTTKPQTPLVKKKERKILYWVAPMDPNYRRDKPGKSPMGMDLTPVYADQQTTEEGIVKISSSVENNLGVKTAIVKRMDLPRIITTVGHVTVDENKIEHIHTYTEGWIKVLNVKTTGELVHQGQLLLELYSPTLINAQEEFLLALKNKNDILIRAGEKKLLTLGVAQSQINQLRKKRRVMQRVKIFSTQNGVVSQLNVREGKFVTPDTDIMSIDDLSQIWMIADVFERQANWVEKGQPAIAGLPYMPGKRWQGKVDYVYPALDPQTHTLRVRLTFPNPDYTIKPKMYANIKILSDTIKNTLAIPQAALIRTGNGDRVILALGNGRYKAQVVKTGIESNDYYQILSGLKAGDVVVTSAQFLIDSESNLKSAFNRMQDGKQLTQEKVVISKPQEFVGMGKVKSINLKKRRLSLFHQPIPALNMPAMTMELAVADEVKLNQVKPGDEIHFVLVKRKDDTYLITKIHVMKNNKHQH